MMVVLRELLYRLLYFLVKEFVDLSRDPELTPEEWAKEEAELVWGLGGITCAIYGALLSLLIALAVRTFT